MFGKFTGTTSTHASNSIPHASPDQRPIRELWHVVQKTKWHYLHSFPYQPTSKHLTQSPSNDRNVLSCTKRANTINQWRENLKLRRGLYMQKMLTWWNFQPRRGFTPEPEPLVSQKTGYNRQKPSRAACFPHVSSACCSTLFRRRASLGKHRWRTDESNKLPTRADAGRMVTKEYRPRINGSAQTHRQTVFCAKADRNMIKGMERAAAREKGHAKIVVQTLSSLQFTFASVFKAAETINTRREDFVVLRLEDLFLRRLFSSFADQLCCHLENGSPTIFLIS